MRHLNKISNLNPTVSVADLAIWQVVFNLKLSNLIDSDVTCHMQLTLELNSAHAKFKV